MVDSASLLALWLSFKLSFITTAILLVIGTPVAWWLANSKWRYKFIIESVVALPLVLPPTVLGFYLLILLSPNHPIGAGLTQLLGSSVLFSFSGLIIGSIIYSFPFVVQPLSNAFSSIDKELLDTAKLLNSSAMDRFFSIILPLAKPGFLTAAVLGFAHTLGEFGIVLMLGGNIPGKTQVVSIAIYDHVDALNYPQAHWLSGILLVLSFVLLVAIYASHHKVRLHRT